jgi:hypothetical protein
VIWLLRRVSAGSAASVSSNLAVHALHGDAGGIADLEKAPIQKRRPNVNALTYAARLHQHNPGVRSTHKSTQPGATIVPTLADTQTPYAKRVTIESGCKVAAVPADFAVVCLWALTGLVVTGLVVAGISSADFTDFLGAAG